MGVEERRGPLVRSKEEVGKELSSPPYVSSLPLLSPLHAHPLLPPSLPPPSNPLPRSLPLIPTHHRFHLKPLFSPLLLFSPSPPRNRKVQPRTQTRSVRVPLPSFGPPTTPAMMVRGSGLTEFPINLQSACRLKEAARVLKSRRRPAREGREADPNLGLLPPLSTCTRPVSRVAYHLPSPTDPIVSVFLPHMVSFIRSSHVRGCQPF